MKVKEHIDHFNKLHGQLVYKSDLQKFYSEIRILNNPSLGELEDKLKTAIGKMNGKPVILKIDEPIKIKAVQPGVKKLKAPKKRHKVDERPTSKSQKKRKVLLSLKGKDGNQVTTDRSKKSVDKIKPASALAGFTTADKAPATPGKLIRLPNEIGNYLQDLQRYKLVIIIAGEFSSGKSEIGKQIADAFISMGDEVAWIDWEQGGLESKDTKAGIDRNVKPENRKHLHVSSTVPKNLDAVKKLAKRYPIIVLDSGSSLKLLTNEWIDELRDQYPDTVWIPLMQQNVKGGTRGGSAAEFDAPVVIKTWRPDWTDYTKNYAELVKDRGNKTGLKYSISQKKILNSEVG